MQRANKSMICAGMVLAVGVMVSSVSQAQPPAPPAGGPGGAPGMRPGGGPGGPGGPGGGDFRKWMEEHRNVMSVGRKLRGVAELNKAPDTKLNKQQSAKMLAIINAWKSKPSMSEDQAKSVDGQITALLNDKQRKQLEAQRGGFGGGGGRNGGGMRPGGPAMAGAPGGMRPGGPGGPGAPNPGGAGAPRGAGAPGGPGGMRPGGGPGGGGGRMAFTMPKTINPLNPSTMSGRMQERNKKSLADFTAELQKQAK